MLVSNSYKYLHMPTKNKVLIMKMISIIKINKSLKNALIADFASANNKVL